MNRSTPKPHYCNAAAHELFAAQVKDLDAEGALLRAAVAISMHDMPTVDYRAVEDQLDQLANRVLSRVHSDNARALIAHAHQVLFEEEGFQGNQENYYDPGNSYIPQVLSTRRGIPITLSLVYKEVLERLGLSVTGTNAPGHFLASVWLDGRPLIVDAFSGGKALSRAEAYDRIEDLLGHVDRSTDLLKPATNRGWLARILQNLQVVFGQSRQQGSLAAMLELSSLLTTD